MDRGRLSRKRWRDDLQVKRRLAETKLEASKAIWRACMTFCRKWKKQLGSLKRQASKAGATGNCAMNFAKAAALVWQQGARVDRGRRTAIASGGEEKSAEQTSSQELRSLKESTKA